MVRIRVAALGVAGVALLLPDVASADVLIACRNKTNGAVRVVADASQCRASEIAFSWDVQGAPGPAGPAGPAGPQGPAGAAGAPGGGVRTVAGIVNADGTKNGVTPNGFTVQRLQAGRYQIDFPAGTWQTFPVLMAVPFGVNGAYGNAVVTVALGFGDGSAQFWVDMSSTTPGASLYDNAFMFIAAAALPSP